MMRFSAKLLSSSAIKVLCRKEPLLSQSYYGVELQSSIYRYRKVVSSNTSCLEAHADFFRLLMKGIFDPYVLQPFDEKYIFKLLTHVKTRDYKVCNVLLS